MITGLLVLVVSYIGDPHSILRHYPFVPPFVIGLFVAGVIACFGPLTSACLNPARDFGPRLTTYMFGKLRDQKKLSYTMLFDESRLKSSKLLRNVCLFIVFFFYYLKLYCFLRMGIIGYSRENA